MEKENYQANTQKEQHPVPEIQSHYHALDINKPNLEDPVERAHLQEQAALHTKVEMLHNTYQQKDYGVSVHESNLQIKPNMHQQTKKNNQQD